MEGYEIMIYEKFYMVWSHLSSVFFRIDIVDLSIVKIYVIIVQLLFSNTDIQFLMNFSLSFD